MCNLKKNDTTELIYKTETDSVTENMPVVAKVGREWGKDGLGIWD